MLHVGVDQHKKFSKIARVAVARKLAEICWKRLRIWHRRNAG